MPCLLTSPSKGTESAPAEAPSLCMVPHPARVHHSECACLTCSLLQTGLLAYRELTEQLGSDDPAVLDPLWLRLCQQRVDDHNQRLLHEAAADPPQSVRVTDR